METTDQVPRGFAQTKLPWIAAGASLILYFTTVSTWLRLDSLGVLARITGWDWTPTLYGSVHYLVTYPFRWLPASVQPFGLNLLSAVLAAATIGLLVRSVALLPYDRTREARMRERSDLALLSIPLAWAGPAFAAALCALQLSFWEHATAATSEMLDLFLFAYVARCILEYRVSERENWLMRMAFVYGLAVTNNHAMIAFFPCFVIATIWARGFGFFNLRFLGRMTCYGAAGLLFYLVLPLAAALSESGETGFWGYLRAVLGNQKSALASFPPYVFLLIGLTSIVPVLIMGIRWPDGEGETSRAGVVMAAFITRFIHVVMLAATVSVFFDPRWSPRRLGFGVALLPFYFLSAVAAGYYLGYVLLVFRESKRAHHRVTSNERLLNRVATATALVGAMIVAGALAWRNFPAIRGNDGRLLYELAKIYIQALPPQGAYVLSDERVDLLILEAALARQGNAQRHVLLASQLLPYRLYHRELEKQYGPRWPHRAEMDTPGDALDIVYLSTLVQDLARSNQVFYLHPSMGYYFESVEMQPQGMVYRLVPRPADVLAAAPCSPEQIATNQQFWESQSPLIERIPAATPTAPVQARYVGRVFARALTTWATQLQRQGQFEPARHWLELALRLNPDNVSAQLTLAFNDELRQAKLKPLSANPSAVLDKERRGLDRLLLDDGQFDHSQATFVLGQVFVQNSLFRQALAEFQRVSALFPDDQNARMRTDAMEAMARFSVGDVPGAEAQALSLQERFPKEDLVLETLTQIYLNTKRFTNALATIDKQLQLDPNNIRALLNKAAISIHAADYTTAIPALNTLLGQQPDNQAALMNRAIAYLQSGQLDASARDYEALRNLMPEYHAVYYGLGEIALRKQDKTAALGFYEDYLKYGNKNSEEYKAVAARVEQLKSGAR